VKSGRRALLFDLDMTVNIEKIYRVVCDDNYQKTNPETYWTKDKQECESYIQSKYYKRCLHIEEAVLTDKALPVNGMC
jgi:hypothetical protein